jgi:hypothetical protein
VRPDCCSGHAEGFGHSIDCAAPASVRCAVPDGTPCCSRLRSIAHIGNNDAVADFHNPIRVVGDLLVMGDKNDGVSLCVKFTQDLHHLRPTVRVKGSGRLVSQNDLAAIHQSAGDRHPLLLAARQLAGNMVRALGQTQPGQQGDRPLMPVGSAASGINGGHFDIAGRAQVAKQMIALEDETEPLAAQRRQLVHVHLRRLAAFDPIIACRRPIQTSKYVHQSRFAGTGGADNGHHLSGFNVEVDILQHPHHLVACGESAGYPTHAYQWLGHGAPYRVDPAS